MTIRGRHEGRDVAGGRTDPDRLPIQPAGPEVSPGQPPPAHPALQLGKFDAESARRREQAAVVAGELDSFPLPADEIDRREMKRVEGPHRNRKGLQCASQDGWGKFEQPNPPDQHLR